MQVVVVPVVVVVVVAVTIGFMIAIMVMRRSRFHADSTRSPIGTPSDVGQATVIRIVIVVAVVDIATSQLRPIITLLIIGGGCCKA